MSAAWGWLGFAILNGAASVAIDDQHTSLICFVGMWGCIIMSRLARQDADR